MNTPYMSDKECLTYLMYAIHYLGKKNPIDNYDILSACQECAKWTRSKYKKILQYGLDHEYIVKIFDNKLILTDCGAKKLNSSKYGDDFNE